MWETVVLTGAAATAAITHTLIPDHWMPYVLMAQAKRWPMNKSLRVTGFGAIVHLSATTLLGILAAVVGSELSKRYSAWAELVGGVLLISFGLYFAWRGWRTFQRGRHHHDHLHEEHPHALERSDFALGAILGSRPCAEALPIFFAASMLGVFSSLAAVGAWVLVTVVSMLGIVWLSLKSLRHFRLDFFEKYGELSSGLLIALVGGTILLLGI
ncbi:MAG: hypothetical protein A2Z21_09175 [Candidatus Fraserbacteria bacterium RBG_16_55_9]|uniref:Urease accessory protein UreH-like transmembrane domain-containing protein n=1 Tax=Fraserbacteria sp. (strain RBG_16_55_9) TaxID=1817864 RepID=A0A1F5UWT3_FRAXR|nr:MAG: hypothetical protein A2Z21_09175 [Candidatus Fraserbacteria bacterium RBG_16_55_9]